MDPEITRNSNYGCQQYDRRSASLIVVVLTARLNTKMLSAQVDSVRPGLLSEVRALDERIEKQLAELELRLSKQSWS